MARIQTQIRLINVKETFEQVKEKIDFQWIYLTEDHSYVNKTSGRKYEKLREIILNKNHIIEVYD